MSFETECFSMNSDMSKRIIERSEPKRNSASERATSVLPTPVGPRKRNEPTGRCGFFNPARERRDGRALRDDAASQLVLDAKELLRLLLLEGGDGDARPARDDVFDVVLR